MTVPSTIAADCSEPVDVQLNRLIASTADNSTLEFAPGGCYGLNDSLWVTDHRHLSFEGNNSTFKIVTTTLNNTLYRSDWRVRRGSGITFRNMTVIGACAATECRNGTTPPTHGDGQHGFSLESTASPTLDHVQVQDVLSDGVAVQATLDPTSGWSGAPTVNLVLTHSSIQRAGRMLVGITAVDGAVIDGNTIANGPNVGVDIEVDVPAFVARHIKILNNTFDNLHAYAVANGGLGADPSVGDITIEGNTMAHRATNCSEGGIYLRSPGPTTPPAYRSGYTVAENHFQTIGPFVEAERIKNLVIVNNTTSFVEAGCGEKAAVVLVDSHNVNLSLNDFSGYPSATFGLATN